MKQHEFVPQVPYGTRDFLPREASKKRAVEGELAQLFANWGYDEVVTPTIEYLETMTVGVGNDIDQHMFKFFDKSNRILALRPDMTTPMARVAATRFKDSPSPMKLFYITNVFRYEQAQAGRQCEFYQAGVEIMGASEPAADAEVIALAVESMLKSGLKKFQIGLGQVDFINGIMEQSEFSLIQRQQIKHAMVTRDLVGLGEILVKSSLSQREQTLLKHIPLLHGREEMLKQAYSMVENDKSRNALDNLATIYQLLENYGVSQYVDFDLGIIRDFEYYTGMVFEGYTPGLGFPICGGGRYDTMLNSFGMNCGATGFALGIERVLLALERQGIESTQSCKDIYIGWNKENLVEAIKQADTLRQSGYSVELAIIPESCAQAEESRKSKGYAKLVYME
ncbi:ATP phosphoribosyltransferase regulatory subunit [Pelosinus propionicus]|uniref:ATP phosphoribosyltransferase regulatory subunit n=1 Tax=Pelosinus propionicus DSM 13327 TaxID=1123291 RepID=A0A1I4KL86_9FIRM|nr:ATP phosphoribosyltransferase regulatory subunit [Pelosinus propionicus]SFL79545.1 ATP phosphoribosyltransferase regulatory subunit [Pelosinus propionicus DSM 13327]